MVAGSAQSKATDSNIVDIKSAPKSKPLKKKPLRSSGSKRINAKKKPKKKASKPAKKNKLTSKKQQQLVVDHQEHGKRLAWSFLTSWRIRLPQDEVVSVVGAALCEAASRFDPKRGVDFKTFFFYHLRGMLLKEISRVIQEQKILHFVPHTVVSGVNTPDAPTFSHKSFPLVEVNNPEKILEKREVAKRCWSACAELDQLEQEVMVRFFAHDEPLVKIAEDLGYCRCHISRVKSRAIKKLGKMLENFSTSADGTIDELNVVRTRRRNSARTASGYTGGRGRRKISNAQKTSDSLSRILKQVNSA